MGKSKKFVGQPILSQILSCIPTDIITQSGNKHKSNRYYKKGDFKILKIAIVFFVRRKSN